MKSGEFKGKLCDRNYTVLIPENANGNWVWRAEFLGAFDYADRALFDRGWAIAYYGVSHMFGNEESVELLKGFHDFAVKEFELENKADIFGFSRGGLYAVNYAIKYPEDVSTIYLDAPVLNLWSWPAGLGNGCGDAWSFDIVKSMYGVDEKTIFDFDRDPIDRVDELIKTKLPVILVAGDSDSVVPYSENGELLKKAYDKAGAEIKIIVKENCDHHPHSLEDPIPIVDFIVSNK